MSSQLQWLIFADLESGTNEVLEEHIIGKTFSIR